MDGWLRLRDGPCDIQTDMPGTGKASASVTAAGIVAIIGGLLVASGGAFATLGIFIAPPNPNGAALPPLAKTIAECLTVFVALLGVFGIVTGVNLLRLKSWARIATLIWSGVTVFFCATILAFTAFTPLPIPPNVPANMQGAVRVAVLTFYGLPLGIGIWWLVLFTRRNVAEQFRGVSPAALDASGFPAKVVAESAPACPLPLLVLGGFLALSAFSVLFAFFTPVPAVVFGQAVPGTPGKVFFVFSCLLCGAAGIGLLRLKTWGFWLAFSLQAFGLLSGIVTVTSPNYFPLMQEMIAASQAKFGGLPSEVTIERLQLYAYMGLMVPVIIGAILLFYRAEFFAAAAAKKPVEHGQIS